MDEVQEKKGVNWWLGVFLIIAVMVIFILLFSKQIPVVFYWVCLIAFSLYLGYRLLMYFKQHPSIHQIIKKIANGEFNSNGFLLDTSTNNVQVKRYIDDFLVNFIKEGKVYSFNISQGIHSRVDSTLYNETEDIKRDTLAKNMIEKRTIEKVEKRAKEAQE